MLASSFAAADQLALPAGPLHRQQSIEVVYQLDQPATGRARLSFEWTDEHARLVQAGTIEADLLRASSLSFPLDLGRAASINNRLRVAFTLEGARASGDRDDREIEVESEFVVGPADLRWSDFQLISWHPRTAAQYATLKEMGLTAGMVFADREGHGGDFTSRQIAPLLRQDLRWYVENAATDFYAAYHRWTPGKPVNWLFLEAQRTYRDNPSDLKAFIREPSLSDPAWLQTIAARMAEVVRTHRAYAPLYYSLADEPGIADLAAAWDFDFSSHSLAGMRVWLRQRYGSLARLNEQWGTSFADWNAVMPMRTTEAMRRSDDNFSAWSDFKEWMDESFMRALRAGADAVKRVDPDARVAIEGAQIPGWGGYDYARVTRAVDTMEVYDFGGSVDLVRSFDPGIVVLSATGGATPADIHRVWRSLLKGTRGLILWDPENRLVRLDGSLGEAGAALAPHLREIRRGLGAALINSRPASEPVGIYYSPASMRVRWMLDFRHLGDAWTERSAESEYQDNALRASMRGYAEGLKRLGITASYVASEQVESGALQRAGLRVLMLPHVIALSAVEIAEIRLFVTRGGTVIADGEPGLFDGHGRRDQAGRLSDLFSPASAAAGPSAGGRAVYLEARYHSRDDRHAPTLAPEFVDGLRSILQDAGLTQPIRVLTAAGQPAASVDTVALRNGQLDVVCLQAPAPSADARPEWVRLILPEPKHVYDMRQGVALGRASSLALPLPPVAPIILALSAEPLPHPVITGPAHARLGQTPAFQLGYATAMPADYPALRVDVLDPRRKAVPHYTRTVIAPGGKAQFELPLALNDPVGRWTLQITDVHSGQRAEWHIEVAGS